MKNEFCDHEWLELYPKGVMFEGDWMVFILENEEKRAFLPIQFPLPSLDFAGQGGGSSFWRRSLQTINRELFREWDIHLKRCVFIKHHNGRHRARLFYKKDGKDAFYDKDVEQILSLCLDAKIPFYATRSYILDSQVVEPEKFLRKQKWTEGRQRYLM